MGQPDPPDFSFGSRNLPPNSFAMVMATGIVALAAHGAGWWLVAHALFWLGAGMYGILGGLLLLRVVRYRAELDADLASHARAPGFFTLAAAPCVLGNQCVIMHEVAAAGLVLLGIGLLFWLVLSYAMVPALMEGTKKPPLEDGLSGAWLLLVVGTQAVSVLSSLLAPALAAHTPEIPLFVALSFWLVGSMLYIWLIALIFHRILFLPLLPNEFTPPYWINMGAMAISTLSGVRLVADSDRMPLLTELLPFLKGMTLLFWATATWWIPVLLALGAWRHLARKVPLVYEPGYWAAVFPLGMYAVCTQVLAKTFHLPFLVPIHSVFTWIALLAWAMTFTGLVCHVAGSLTRLKKGPAQRREPDGAPTTPGG